MRLLTYFLIGTAAYFAASVLDCANASHTNRAALQLKHSPGLLYSEDLRPLDALARGKQKRKKKKKKP
jgi:hypothetical protein